MADEARSILDSLMGGDRNAPLPPGTAVPRRKKGRFGDSSQNQNSNQNHSQNNQPLLLPSTRSRSCYDADADPLYCAWGVNVYELFVNTKSDIGSNPFTPDDGARQEYLRLPKHEQERLGFDSVLFLKLQELVRQCDRTVSRNKEKLEQEIQRNAATKNRTNQHHDYVQDIDEVALTQLAQCQLRRDAVEQELLEIVATMEAHIEHQGNLEGQLETLKNTLQEMESKLVASTVDETNTEKHVDDDNAAATSTDAVPIKSESDAITEEPQHDESICIKADPDATNVKTEDAPTTTTDSTTDDDNKDDTANTTKLELLRLDIEQLTKELDDVILKKQRSQFDLARKIQQYAPLQESADQQRKHLHFVKSDITMDKTVCEVSGNFMSARDADERIAAHYAGKQYVGWKLVRDKFKEMQQQYGRYGPPRPPPRRDDIGGPGPGPGPIGRNVGGRPDDRYNGRGGGFNNNRGPPPPARGGAGGYSGGGGGRDYDRGGGGRDRDRGGHQGGGYGRGGGYDRDRRDGGGGRWGR